MIWLRLIGVLITLESRVYGYQKNDYLKQRNVNVDQPVDTMTDVINNLGVKLLNCYSHHSGNVAFSPALLTFVLVAVYEGTAGRTSQQISHVLKLPRDRHITRIGLRDIHRRLRSYLNADTFLAGLTLNQDNVQLRPEYEDILRFYGFNVDTVVNNNTMNSTDQSTMTLNTNSSTTNMTNALVLSNVDITNSSSANNTVVPTPSINLIASDITIDNSTNSSSVQINQTLNQTKNRMPPTVTDLTGMPAVNIMDMMAVESSPDNMTSNQHSLTSDEADQFVTIDMVPTVSSAIDIGTKPSVINSSSRKKRLARSQRSFDTIPVSDSTDQGTTELNFQVNGIAASIISTAYYTAILPFAHIHAIHSFAVEFPLDDSRYNVIMVLPADSIRSRNLIRLLSGETLRHIRKSMKPTWVKMQIPSFMLGGFVRLTSYLQMLGIKDMFEPRAANLSPMTPDLGVYVRDIQQSINVNIRNFMKDDLSSRTHNRTSTTSTLSPSIPTLDAKTSNFQDENLLHSKHPVPFIADRSFIFFIIDVHTSAAVTAGRIDDPLNSRLL
ncbi:uncharacterized protein LOC122848947 isoform X2 [Aphidius gifuensis]|uniref:uncharacterized protein LOC122848947 isoform X2 n=1 Tax=Aphidius gifuensis TaxID=684658 RepID=UPI001CDCB22F|nr:uncharacterized protein LOC122848947 isoform X2 [Aphidius gifuensis]